MEQPGKVKGGGLAEVDVQQLGKQAVVKVVCSRRPGHVLRVLNALEECKVEVLQSNVVTVADNSIHFITVQVPLNLALPSPPHRHFDHIKMHTIWKMAKSQTRGRPTLLL